MNKASLALNISLVNRCLSKYSCLDCKFNDKEYGGCMFELGLFPEDPFSIIDNLLSSKEKVLARLIERTCSKYYECEFSGCEYFKDDECKATVWIKRVVFGS